MAELKLVEFIKNNSNWEELLSEKPYCIRVSRDNGMVMFRYMLGESDFFNEVVCECRGIILEDITFKPVCIPFFKFGNYGESYVKAIDWDTARTEEKIDGSLIKLFNYNNIWRVSTNGTIDAFKAELSLNDIGKTLCNFKTFGDLFMFAINDCGLDLTTLNKNYTYMFEIVSPYNKIIIEYPKTEIYHIGTRDNDTLEELSIDIGVKKPTIYPLNSLEACLSSAESLPKNKEGYVVVDNNWNRIKIKSFKYVAFHYAKGNGFLNKLAIIQLIRDGDYEEFITYFPEYKNALCDIIVKIENIIHDLEMQLIYLKYDKFKTKKEFADCVKGKPFFDFLFVWYDNKFTTPRDWFWKMDNYKIRRIINQ